MITVFARDENGINFSMPDASLPLPEGVVWVDLHNPTLEEEKSIEAQLRVQIPSREEVWKNQVLNRFYQEDGVSYMTAAIINKVDSPHPQISAITVVLAPGYLVTLRYIQPTSFSNFSQRLLRYPQKFITGNQLLEGLLEEVIMRVAHNSEILVSELDNLSHDIFGTAVFEENRSNPSTVMKGVIRRLGTYADLNSKISESLQSLQRLLDFFNQVHGSGKEMDIAIRTLMTDVNALNKQTAHIATKINFLLDSTLGMINVEQNMIIKIFSVVAVFFMPPTLLSSIYGMNFAHMPELHWEFGYPYALFLMMMCAVIPYHYFRKKGWL